MPNRQSVCQITRGSNDFLVFPSACSTPADDLRADYIREEARATNTVEPADGNYVYGVWRLVYITLAGMFFVLAIVGIAIPGLPTTPFLLLTGYFLSRSWPKMHKILLANNLFGPMLYHWQQHRALQRRTKLQATLLIGTAMVVLSCFSGLPPSLVTILMMLALVGLVMIYRLPTLESKLTSAS
jgi:uncharacterized membrane protein YbaN (DUF454 family)